MRHQYYDPDPDVVFVSETRVKQESQSNHNPYTHEIERLRVLLHQKTLECDRLNVEREDFLAQFHTQLGILSGVRTSLLRTIQPLSEPPMKRFRID
jgi:hypothetical protein